MDHHAGQRELLLRAPSPVEELFEERLASRGVRLVLKRDDLIHPDLPGNKWRKLKNNLAAAREEGHHTLLTFGGAYSNHIRAVAAAGLLFGFRTVGVIRGEQHLPLNAVLADASGFGMTLTYLDRADYRDKDNDSVLRPLIRTWGPCYVIPEGGSNALAVRGCAELAMEIREQVPDVSTVCCPVGTGGTLAGIAAGLEPPQTAVGFAVLKGAAFLRHAVGTLQEAAYGVRTSNWSIDLDHHFGGYARRNAALDDFIDEFTARQGLVLDWVYVAKMMAGIYALADDGRFPPGSTVVAVVTGRMGLTGPGLTGGSAKREVYPAALTRGCLASRTTCSPRPAWI